MSFTAQFGGECDSCSDPIDPGQEIDYNMRSRVVHVICPEAKDVPVGEVCPRCFMERAANGSCGCDA